MMRKCINLTKILALGAIILLVGCAGGAKNAANHSPSVYVTAHGEGSTKQAALNDAFRDAIQRSAGVVINSQMVMQDGRITQDLIQEYSGAFVTSYEIKRQRQTSNGYSVNIAANISSTKIANRLLELSRLGTSAKPNTDQFYAQVSTLLKSRIQGDAFLNNILSEYPHGALKVSVGPPSPRVTEYRNVFLDIPLEISWSKTYLDALRETVDFLSVGSCSSFSGQLRCPYDIAFAGGRLMRVQGFKLVDEQQASLVYSRLRPQVVLVVNFYETNDQLIGKKCLAYDMSVPQYDPRLGRSMPVQLMTVSRGIEIIEQPYQGRWSLGFQNPEDMRAIQRIDAEVMAHCPADAQI